MSVLWERLAGHTGRFAVKLAFHEDPEQGDGVDPDVAASWGAFQVWVGGRNLCAHVVQGEVVESVHWYLLPMLQWLARNWSPLFHEEKLPSRVEADDAWTSLRRTRFPPMALPDPAAERWEREWSDWWERHCLSAARDGGVFPDIVFRRWRDEVEVSWGPARLPGVPSDLQFLAPEGSTRFMPEEVAVPFHAVLSAAVEHLKEDVPDSSVIQDLATRVEGIRRETTEVRLAWMAGLGADPSAIRANWDRVKSRVGTRTPAARAVLDADARPLVLAGSCHAALMFGSVSPRIGVDDIGVLATKLVELYRPEAPPAALDRFVADRPVEDERGPAWQQGYLLAKGLVDSLALDDGDRVDVDALASRLGVTCADVELDDTALRAVAIAGPSHPPAILVNRSCRTNQGRAGRRFTLAHELCHLLHDRGRGRKLALASGPWAPLDVERRANAFAAMLLMPPETVQRAIAAAESPPDSLAGVRQVARTLDTGFDATLHHLANLGVIDETTRDTLRAEGVGAA